MINCDKILSGVEKVLALYGVAPVYKDYGYKVRRGELLDEYVVLNGREYPLLYWRKKASINKMKSVSRRIGKIVSVKINACVGKEVPVKRLAVQNCDIAEYLADAEITDVKSFSNGRTANVIARLNGDALAVLELSGCLPENSVEQGVQTVFARNGFVSDKVPAQLLKNEAVHLFAKGKHETYSDYSCNLYGFNEDELTRVSAVYSLLTGKTSIEGIEERVGRLTALADKIFDAGEKGG